MVSFKDLKRGQISEKAKYVSKGVQMSVLRILDILEGPIATKLYSDKPEDQWKDQYWQKVENITKLKRERLLVIFILLSLLNFALWDSIPILAHFFCIMNPFLDTLKMMQNLEKYAQVQIKNQFLSWIFLAIVCGFDYTRLSSLPFYYFAKMGLCGFIWHKGIDQFAEYFEPFLQLLKSCYGDSSPVLQPDTRIREDPPKYEGFDSWD